MTQSRPNMPSDGPAEPYSLAVNIFVNRQLVYSTDLTSSLELGRQRPNEKPPYERIGDRVVIARLEESDVSRRHVQLHLLPGKKIRVVNCSRVNTLLVGKDDEVRPGDHRDVSGSTLITLFGRVIQIQPHGDPAQAPGKLESFSHKTDPPRTGGGGTSSITEVLSARRSKEETEFLLRGLHATIDIFQLASGRAEFLDAAAKALIDVVGLETAAALSWTGDRWQVDAFASRSGSESKEPPQWQPSRTILHQVRDKKQTFWHIPDFDDAGAASLIDVKALIAAPILNNDAEVIGALYGDRRSDLRHKRETDISEVEAILVEVLATGVASGLARLEHQQAAVRARVLFEQFFTTELSRQLEAEPDLLLGKDMEVSLLFCDIRRFSEVSEKLGARLTIDWINDVMGTLSECIMGRHGVLVDTLGDELIGMWGAPVARSEHAELACRAALDMFQQLPALGRRWQDALDRPMDLAVGIHTGTARVGNIGSEKKFKYGPLGSTVQIASRTRRATEHLKAKILITGKTASALSPEFFTRRLCRVQDEQLGGTLDLFELATTVPDDWSQFAQRYESALEAYERRDLPTATRLLAKILVDHPGDRPSLQLMARIQDDLPDVPWSF